MFSVGDFVIHANTGICTVTEITTLDMATDANMLYYILIPLGKESSKVYLPVEGSSITCRPIISKDVALNVINKISQYEAIEIKTEKEREQTYKENLRCCECENWCRLLKTLYCRKVSRLKEGKKTTVVDDRYIKLVEDFLYGELSFVLEQEKKELSELFKSGMITEA